MRKSLLDEYRQSGLFKANNPPDVLHLDVPLFIRLLEYAREEARNDMQLHDVSERLLDVCASGSVATMKHYRKIVQ